MDSGYGEFTVTSFCSTDKKPNFTSTPLASKVTLLFFIFA